MPTSTDDRQDDGPGKTQRSDGALSAEFSAALLIAAVGYNLVGRQLFLMEDTPPTAPYLLLYIIKVVVAFGITATAGVRAIVYSILLTGFVCSGTLLPGHQFDSNVLIAVKLGLWCGIPTLTFLADVLWKGSLRSAVWRSVFEIVVVIPLSQRIVATIVVYVMEAIMGIHI